MYGGGSSTLQKEIFPDMKIYENRSVVFHDLDERFFYVVKYLVIIYAHMSLAILRIFYILRFHVRRTSKIAITYLTLTIFICYNNCDISFLLAVFLLTPMQSTLSTLSIFPVRGNRMGGNRTTRRKSTPFSRALTDCFFMVGQRENRTHDLIGERRWR